MTSISSAGCGCRIDMHYILIVKAAHDMGDGIDMANMSQEAIAQALALVRALDQTGDIHKVDPGRDRLRHIYPRLETSSSAHPAQALPHGWLRLC